MNSTMNRNTFLKSVGRMFFLGVFAAATAYLWAEGRISSPGECRKEKYCENCGSFSRCELPKAIEQRDNGRQ